MFLSAIDSPLMIAAVYRVLTGGDDMRIYRDEGQELRGVTKIFVPAIIIIVL